MSFFKMLLGFAPWICLLSLAHGSLERLKIGLVVVAALTVGLAVTRLHRGVIMWVGLLFFAYAIVAVVIQGDLWAVRHMAALANGALAVAVWAGIALKRPFTLEYARKQTDPALWTHPVFLRTNHQLSTAWAAAFSACAALAWQRSAEPAMPGWAYEVASNTLLLSAMLFSTWYPAHLKRRRQAQAAQAD